ncbi:hypothetical protein SNE40_023246 [Patella caerulea]|uniref:Uncharacterized protein n=1 Tax=Patella caerulea TaxID=87958 RepID=A0AAN8G2L2_PATCE
MFSYAPNACYPSPSFNTDNPSNKPLYSTGIFYRQNVSQGVSRDAAFTQSLRVTSRRDVFETNSDFIETVQVLPSASGRYQIYRPGSYTNVNRNMTQIGADGYKHNICNPDMQNKYEKILTGDSKTLTSSASTSSKSMKKKIKSKGKITPTRIPDNRDDLECSCKLYHSHVFLDETINVDILKLEEQRLKAVENSRVTEIYQAEGNEDPGNIFWTPGLSFHPYKNGDSLVDFASLWPGKNELRDHLQNSGVQTTVLRNGTVSDLGRQAIVCGPIHLLDCLIQLRLIRVDQQFENGSSMLHLACLSRNTESVLYLIQTGISPKIRDKHGCTADQVTYCPKIKRLLPPKYHRDTNITNRTLLDPSRQDKDIIFSLAKNPKNFDDIQKRLQTFDFNVNTECDSNGDFLLHMACNEGLCQLPLIMALVKIQHADVELCNADGMTPLMLTATAGNSVLCDVLMCLFGANPNKSNPHNGRYALHYAVEGNHRKSVECLIRRGADVNVEDHEGRRPDDVPSCIGPDDSCEIIKYNRKKRLDNLSQSVKEGNIESSDILFTDLYTIDDDNNTLIMAAAVANQVETMSRLLAVNKTTINAQHCQTGMTALAIAAQNGYRSCCQLLLLQGANPAISDMKGLLPLHHAVFNNHEPIVDLFCDFFPVAYTGLYKALRMSKKSSIHVKLKAAYDKRQDEIVTPTLLSCAFNGDAEELFVLLDEGDSINPKTGTGNWPMYLAVENGHLDVLKLLIERGGDIRKRHGVTGATVLHVAARMGHYHIMEHLVNFCKTNNSEDITSYHGGMRKKVDINSVDSEKKTALQVAAEKGFSKMVQLLLNYGATTALLDNQGLLFTCCEYEGVRMLIESHRERHTKHVMKLISDKSKKAPSLLQKVWLPRFDHNLRTKQGDTPLMVACHLGRLQMVKILLDSSIYSNMPADDSGDDSDADSGVLDHTWAFKRNNKLHKSDDGENVSQASGNFNQSTEVNLGGAELQYSGDISPCLDDMPEIKIEETTNDKTLRVLLQDVQKPKGLQIFHDSLVSHVCAVNLFNGNNALHYTIQGGDNLPIIKNLLTADISCLNVQNDDGLSPLHLACKLGRRKSIEVLLAYEGIDLNTRTLQGLLPEEMTTNKTIIKLIQKARLNQTGQMKPQATPEVESPSASKSPSVVGSLVNFDKLHNKYEALKKEVKATDKT